MNEDNNIKFPAELVTIKDWIRWCSTQFEKHNAYYGHGTDNAWDEAIALVLWSIRQPWDRLEWVLDAKLDGQECNQLFELARARVVDKTPVAYLTGEAWFAGIPFTVDKNVLIPRSPIAQLIDNQFAPYTVAHPDRILDLCTGSGCIGIVCALAYEDSKVDLADISSAAINIANVNIARYQLEDRVTAIESDLFSNINAKYDIIVTNPPYVDAQDMSNLPAEFLAEPVLALASGDDGLDITRKILAEASRYLTDNGILVCEVGNSFEALERTMPDIAFYWPELEHGGHGVFILTKAQCDELAQRKQTD